MDAVKRVVQLLLTLVLGMAVTGFVAGTLRSAVPDWSDEATALVYVIGIGATLAAAIVEIVRAIRHRDEPAGWGVRGALRLIVAVAIFFSVSLAVDLLVTAYEVGRSMPVEGVGTPWAASPAALHYGGPLLGLALGGLFLAWPRIRAARRRAV